MAPSLKSIALTVLLWTSLWFNIY